MAVCVYCVCIRSRGKRLGGIVVVRVCIAPSSGVPSGGMQWDAEKLLCTVEYHDLSHLFQLVPPLLPMRLALRFVPLLLIFNAQLLVE